MATLYIQLGTDLTVNPELGFSLLNFNVAVTQVTQDIIIPIEKQFIYYNDRYLAALNGGVITQAIYDTITINQSEFRQVYEIEPNLSIDKQSLIDLVLNYNIQNVNTATGTAAEIVEDVIIEGYVFVKKI